MTATTRPIYGRVPEPAIVDRNAIAVNTAFDRSGERLNVGTCTHRMVGSLAGTDGYFKGEARTRALTDYGIGGPWDGGNDGAIWRWVPESAAIAPWANGPANDLDGDGIAYVQRFGITGVNRDLKSIEISDGGQHLRPFGPDDTPKQFEAHAQLVAWIFDQQEVPWDSFPIHPRYGLNTYLEHWEFGPKECPFEPVRSKTLESQARIRAILKQHQTGVGTEPTIPRPAPDPVRPFSATLDQYFLNERWGAIRRVYRDGAAALEPSGIVKRYRWNPKWIPCSAWLHRCTQEATWPSPGDWTSYPRNSDADPVSYIEFSNGWMLLHFAEKGWRWAGKEAEAAK